MSRRRSIAAAMLALAFVATSGFRCSLEAPPPLETKGAPEDIIFAAPTYSDFGAFRRGQSSATAQVPGKLWLPDASGKVPAIIVAHSIGGWNDNGEGRYVQPLQDAGYAVLRINHFSGRGIVRAADVPNAINPITTASDALLALRAISTHPRIDAKRVGVMGLSLGGFTSELAAYEFVRRRVLGDDGLRFAAHVPFYGPCSIIMTNGGGKLMAGGPVLRLLGEKDELSPAASCETIERRVKQLQPDIVFETIWYPAYHAWDNSFFQPPRFFPNHVNRRACAVVDFGGPMPSYLTVEGNTRRFDPTEDIDCRRRSNGYTMGYDEATTVQARTAMLAFFDRHVKNSAGR